MAARARLTRGRPLLRAAAVTATVWAVTGARSLRREAERAAVALDTNDLAVAREVLPGLSGATQPTSARRTSPARWWSRWRRTPATRRSPRWSGPRSPGLPGLTAAYRAVNTLDAMVGYRSRGTSGSAGPPRASTTWPTSTARLTAALAAACAPAVGGSPRASLRAVRRDGGHHPSPNAGRPEAAFAERALGLRLGGASSYQDVTEYRPELGDGRAPEPRDIRRAVRLSRAVTVSAAALAALAALAPNLPGPASSGPASQHGFPGRGLLPVGRPSRSPGRTRGGAR